MANRKRAYQAGGAVVSLVGVGAIIFALMYPTLATTAAGQQIVVGGTTAKVGSTFKGTMTADSLEENITDLYMNNTLIIAEQSGDYYAMTSTIQMAVGILGGLMSVIGLAAMGYGTLGA